MPEKCADMIGLLSGYIDGELSAEETAAVEEHAASCENCRKEIKRLNNITELLRNIPKYQASTRLLSEVREEIKKRRTFRDLLRPALKLGAGLAVAALVLFFIKHNFAVHLPQKTVPASNEISFPWNLAKKNMSAQDSRPQADTDYYGGGRTESFESDLSRKGPSAGLAGQSAVGSNDQICSPAYLGETGVLRGLPNQKNYIIRTVDEWNDFYPLVFPEKEMPYVDFSAKMVVGVCGPGNLRIVTARAAKGKFLVSCHNETKKKHPGEYSCCLKVIEKTDLDIEFTRD